MIIADTSVWIDYFNGILSPFTDELDEQLMKGNVALGDLILLEILQGIKSDEEYTRAIRNAWSQDGCAMCGLLSVIEETRHHD